MEGGDPTVAPPLQVVSRCSDPHHLDQTATAVWKKPPAKRQIDPYLKSDTLRHLFFNPGVFNSFTS